MFYIFGALGHGEHENMKPTDKNDRFRRYFNRALLVFWVLLMALAIRACNQPAHAETEQAIQSPVGQGGLRSPGASCTMRSFTMPMMMSSRTKPPSSMIFFASKPRSVPALIATLCRSEERR